MPTDNWIDLALYEDEIDRIESGATWRVNHKDCPAGEDTKRRLYITKPANDPHLVLGYCHNCNGKSVRTGDSGYRSKAHDHYGVPIPSISRGSFAVPQGLVSDPSLWPMVATTWRIEKGLSENDCFNFGIKHDPNSNHMYLPIWKTMEHTVDGQNKTTMGTTNLLGYQLRRLEGRGPKYLTALQNENVIPSTYIQGITSSDIIIVLVEDYASGIAVWKSSGRNVGVLVNYGVKNVIQVLNRAPKAMTTGVVWLDNDSPHVEAMAGQIARTWELITGARIVEITRKNDPKNCSDAEILDLIEGAITP